MSARPTIDVLAERVCRVIRDVRSEHQAWVEIDRIRGQVEAEARRRGMHPGQHHHRAPPPELGQRRSRIDLLGQCGKARNRDRPGQLRQGQQPRRRFMRAPLALGGRHCLAPLAHRETKYPLLS